MTETIKDAVKVTSVVDNKFKTMQISMNIILPLDEETASKNALLPAMVSRVTKKYPDYTALSTYLSGMYGSTLSSGVSKIGDNQVLSIATTGISNKYALSGENIENELTELICSAVFDPYLEDDGNFPEEGFNQEKRQVIENIDADFNDKKAYASKKSNAELFKTEKSGISRYGTKEQVMKVTRQELKTRWEEILRGGTFEIFILGDCDSKAITKKIASYFDFPRSPVKLTNTFVKAKDTVSEITETMEVQQSKLVMGFKSEISNPMAFKLMTAIFGGTTTSKLFLNVREKMGLCYYCSARSGELKGIMMVESGVETAKVGQAKEEILNQFSQMTEGNFTEEDINMAKLTISNSYGAIGDSLGSVKQFYFKQMFQSEILTPKEELDKLMVVTKDDIIKSAKETKLDTIFSLVNG